MTIRAGDDRSQLRPLRPDGTIDHDLAGRVIVGNHKGQYSGFNIVDPRPGTVHQFGRREDVLSAKQRGWWVADPERDGRPAFDLMNEYLSDVPGGANDESFYPGYVHLVTSEENYRRLLEEQQAQSKAALTPNGLGFLENVSQEEYETGRTSSGDYRSTRFATRDHGTFIAEGDKVIEHLSPRGILREENF